MRAHLRLGNHSADALLPANMRGGDAPARGRWRVGESVAPIRSSLTRRRHAAATPPTTSLHGHMHMHSIADAVCHGRYTVDIITFSAAVMRCTAGISERSVTVWLFCLSVCLDVLTKIVCRDLTPSTVPQLHRWGCDVLSVMLYDGCNMYKAVGTSSDESFIRAASRVRACAMRAVRDRTLDRTKGASVGHPAASSLVPAWAAWPLAPRGVRRRVRRRVGAPCGRAAAVRTLKDSARSQLPRPAPATPAPRWRATPRRSPTSARTSHRR